MEITIKVEGLEGLTEAIALLGSGLAVQRGSEPRQAAKKFTDVQDKVDGVDKKKKLEEIKQIADEGPVPKKEEGAKEGPTREEVRALFISKNSPTNRSTLKDILNKYGAENISTLDPEYFASAIQDLEALA